MKVHELVEKYKRVVEEMKSEHEHQVWLWNRQTAYLQSLDPSTEVKTGLWNGFLEWDNKQRGKL